MYGSPRRVLPRKVVRQHASRGEKPVRRSVNDVLYEDRCLISHYMQPFAPMRRVDRYDDAPLGASNRFYEAHKYDGIYIVGFHAGQTRKESYICDRADPMTEECGMQIECVIYMKRVVLFVDRASQIGAVFLTRGVGASIGNLISAKLYTWVRGKIAVSVTLFLLAVSLIWMPLARDVGTLHLNFLAIGFLTAIVDTGCQLMTRRLYGSAAGPWLGANTVAFGLCGAISPLIGWLTGSLVVEYSILAAVTFIIGFVLVVLPRPDSQPSLREVIR